MGLEATLSNYTGTEGESYGHFFAFCRKNVIMGTSIN
jgi:hypothetical protein